MGTVTDEYNPSAFHHLKSGIEFMAAPSAADAVAFGHHLFGPDAHAPAVEAAHQMAWLLVQGFVARAAKAIDRLPIEFPQAAGVIHIPAAQCSGAGHIPAAPPVSRVHDESICRSASRRARRPSR